MQKKLNVFGRSDDSHIMVEFYRSCILELEHAEDGVINMICYVPDKHILEIVEEDGIDRMTVDSKLAEMHLTNIPQELTDFLDEWFDFHTRLKETTFPYA